MSTVFMRNSENLLFYGLIPFVVYAVTFSYVRFIVNHDYVVAYESECDPLVYSCFVRCADEECKEKHYFKRIQKYAPTLFSQCGKDITGCVQAQECTPEDNGGCSILYCDPLADDSNCEELPYESEILTPDTEATMNQEGFSGINAADAADSI